MNTNANVQIRMISFLLQRPCAITVFRTWLMESTTSTYKIANKEMHFTTVQWTSHSRDALLYRLTQWSTCTRNVRNFTSWGREKYKTGLKSSDIIGKTCRTCIITLLTMLPLSFICMPNTHFQFFVKDTHYRSQFETSKSSGSLSRTARISW